jgi:hypothetical protein
MNDKASFSLLSANKFLRRLHNRWRMLAFIGIKMILNYYEIRVIDKLNLEIG